MTAYNTNDIVPVTSIPKNKRINNLYHEFEEKYGCTPSFYVRVPGRVNIIGEHIDYCGYPVLPMAVEQDILLAANIIEERNILIRNVNKKYNDYDIDIKTFENIIIDADPNGKPYWYNYVLCGVKGALEYLNDNFKNGLQLLIDGNIPPASGLSSSSALVSATCLAFLYAQNENLSKTEIASLCARSERYIGTQGGGMDQAIAFLAQKNNAQYITWNPLKATSVALPENIAFVVAHSLAEANKAATNDFNRRVIECRLAAKIIAKVNGVSNDNEIITLSQVQRLLNKNLEQMIHLVLKNLPNNLYNKSEICELLAISETDMESSYLTHNTKYLQEFKLKQRALHVYEEAIRVERFRSICTKNVGNGDFLKANCINGSATNGTSISEEDKTTKALGELISASHESLKNLYECSHENLDRLVDLSKSMNVYARLTGAGWGGCIVALCSKQKVTKYIEILKTEFYEKFCNIDTSEIDNYVFATIPNHGAMIYIENP